MKANDAWRGPTDAAYRMRTAPFRRPMAGAWWVATERCGEYAVGAVTGLRGCVQIVGDRNRWSVHGAIAATGAARD